jgi:hypothetical protein
MYVKTMRNGKVCEKLQTLYILSTNIISFKTEN